MELCNVPSKELNMLKNGDRPVLNQLMKKATSYQKIMNSIGLYWTRMRI